MAFLSDLRRFYGTGEKNPAGQSLEEFLEHYNPAKYESLCNTADIVVVRCEEKLTHWGQPLKVLMVKRSNHPSIGFWATPGGFVELKEDISEGAARELEEETGYRAENIEWLMDLRTTVAFCDEFIDVYLARDLVKSTQHLDEGEAIDVEAHDVDELCEMIYAGKIQDSKTVSAILAYKNLLNKDSGKA